MLSNPRLAEKFESGFHPVPLGTEGFGSARYHKPTLVLNLLLHSGDRHCKALTKETPVKSIATSQTLRIVNFTVGFALLVMLFPLHGRPAEKPAGVRTAIEMVSKKTTLKATLTQTAAA